MRRRRRSGSSRPTRLRPLLLLVSLSVAGAFASPAPAQTSKILDQGESAPAQRVDGDESIETAVRSFAEAARAAAERMADGSPELDAAAAAELASAATGRFRETLTELVGELQGDGALTLDEVTKTFADARESALASLEEALDARAKGAEPPPAPEESDDSISYVSRLFEYTLVVRNPLHRWLLLFLSIVGGIVAAGSVVGLLRLLSGPLADRVRFPVRRIVDALRGPLYFGAATVGVAVGLTFVWVPVPAADFLWTIVRLLFSCAGFWLGWNLCDLLASGLGWVALRTRGTADDDAVDLVRKSLRLFLLVVLALFVTEVVLDMDVRSLLAGLGIVALGVSLAAQDSLKNLFGSFTIYGDRPFKRGDLVVFKGYFGTIEEIGFRSTQLRTLDGHRVTIPNADIVRETVENVSDRPFVRRRFRLDLVYETPPAKVKEALEIVRAVLDERDDLSPAHGDRVAFEEFGEHSLRIVVEVHHGTDDYWEAKRRDGELNLALLERFGAAGIEFAYPTEKLYVEARTRSAAGDDGGPGDEDPDPEPGPVREDGPARPAED
ncbi:MAG: mechanosensitive ion channel family protein [Planctomycetota bacterium JB042]